MLGGGGWSWVEVEINWVEVDGLGWSWVEVDGTRWRWVHGLAIPIYLPVFHNLLGGKFHILQWNKL